MGPNQIDYCRDASQNLAATGPTVLFGPEGRRKLVIIVNDGDNEIYVRLRAPVQGDAPASVNSGIRLNRGGGSLTLDGGKFKGAIEAIAATGATLITAVEVYEGP